LRLILIKIKPTLVDAQPEHREDDGKCNLNDKGSSSIAAQMRPGLP